MVAKIVIDKTSDPLRLDMGQVRNFGWTDVAEQGLKSGWAIPEETHAWNDGPEAVLSLATTPPDFRCVLVVEGVPLINVSAAKQDLTIFGNGIRLGFWRLTSESPVQIEVLIEPSLWRIENEMAIMKLALHLPNSIRLSSIQSDGDDRELGFCFRTLALFPAPNGH